MIKSVNLHVVLPQLRLNWLMHVALAAQLMFSTSRRSRRLVFDVWCDNGLLISSLVASPVIKSCVSPDRDRPGLSPGATVERRISRATTFLKMNILTQLLINAAQGCSTNITITLPSFPQP